MQDIEEYSGLPDDLVGAAKRWIEWLEFERPEDEPLPGEFLPSRCNLADCQLGSWW